MSLNILNKFASFSGLRVNWGKSSILPLDEGAREVSDSDLLLRWVTSLTYLGFRITANVHDYSI